MEKMPMSDMVDRRVYRVRSRNLVVGAWRAETRGFIGIREKFGALYLFEEYHTETGPPFGTAFAIQDLGIAVPEEVPLTEYLDESRGARMLRTNQALFDLLRPFDKQINEQLVAENDRARQEAESKRWAPPTREEFEREQKVQAARDWYAAQPREEKLRSKELFKEFQRRLKEAYADQN